MGVWNRLQMKMTQGEFDAVAARLKSGRESVIERTLRGRSTKMGVKAWVLAIDGETLTVEVMEKPFWSTRGVCGRIS